MTSTSHPTHDELMQLALLEAYGLLDEYEEADFGRMFRDVSATDQDDIRELQAEVAADLAILPDLDPPADLKARVLARVAAAVDSEESTLAPLARIGRAQQSQFIDLQEHRRNLRAATFWRAAVFVMCAALIVSLYFLADALRTSTRIAELALQNQTEDQIKLSEELEPGWTHYLYDPTGTAYTFVSTNGAKVVGKLWVPEHQRDAFLRLEGLELSASYTLHVWDVKGRQMREVVQFTGSDARGKRVNLSQFALGTNPRWAIHDENNEPVMHSV